MALIAIVAGYGLTAAGYPVPSRAFTGSAGFEGGFSLVVTAWGAAGLIDPFAAGRLFERSGDFTAAFAWGAAAALAAFFPASALARHLARLPRNGCGRHRAPDRSELPEVTPDSRSRINAALEKRPESCFIAPRR